MDNSNRYYVSTVSDSDYLIVDTSKPKGNVYLLFVIPVRNKWYSHQIILTYFDSTKNPSSNFVILESELWSTFMYLDAEGLKHILNRIVFVLREQDILEPYELSYVFGGSVHGKIPRVPEIAR